MTEWFDTDFIEDREELADLEYEVSVFEKLDNEKEDEEDTTEDL
jgi:hypothetical protein